jgi:hypothetical protein
MLLAALSCGLRSSFWRRADHVSYFDTAGVLVQYFLTSSHEDHHSNFCAFRLYFGCKRDQAGDTTSGALNAHKP